MMEWLVESVLADIRNSVMDQGSMWELANELMLNADFERASRYIIFTSECANRYGSRQRNWQISPLLSDIAKGYKGKSEKTTRQLRWLLGVTSVLALALLACGGVILRYSHELNAFAVGEDNARHIGVNVKRVKLIILITISVLIGVCVSVSGTVSFVGLVMPHIARMLVGPNHKRLLPASLFSGAIFLLLADLTARTLLSPIELSIGVVTSIVGAVAFVIIFSKTRKAR
jgi:ABC-type Fe3+-siderophore transport system permease subunit